ncbi:hypothetical protein PPO43_09040 [Saprospira sp. CCB-QB6]|uniref:hypothetical protein n=1 Tax=Saprospira sp. CCB-QB6 TaxID=3023936 RepID=UPI00234B3DD6|nr:hypothetical protein [Saprospira sp. CCB-QB6]WCL80121.1 hypothetical protein PPO43_09040 [Saprospira sp. CCB-QB6]
MLIHRLFSLEDRRFFCGPRPALLAAAMLRRSQVCSALRHLRRLGLACGHGCAALGRSSNFFLLAVFFGS